MNDYQRYMEYKDNAETMGRLGQMPIEVAKATAAYYEEKAKNCSIDVTIEQVLAIGAAND